MENATFKTVYKPAFEGIYTKNLCYPISKEWHRSFDTVFQTWSNAGILQPFVRGKLFPKGAGTLSLAVMPL